MIRIADSRCLLAGLSLALLASCTSAPPAQQWHGPSPEELVGEIRDVGATKSGELDVQPLRDPMVEDLRAQATGAEHRQRYADAAAALDKALALSPDDPALLQERAEIAVLQKDMDKAGRLARSAYALGAKVGPLCRRHWATIRLQLAHRQRQLELPAGHKPLKGDKLAQWERDVSDMDSAIAEAIRHQSECTQTGPPRY
jgi:tetratricopeptide (TPR) repeat protein